MEIFFPLVAAPLAELPTAPPAGAELAGATLDPAELDGGATAALLLATAAEELPVDELLAVLLELLAVLLLLHPAKPTAAASANPATLMGNFMPMLLLFHRQCRTQGGIAGSAGR